MGAAALGFTAAETLPLQAQKATASRGGVSPQSGPPTHIGLLCPQQPRILAQVKMAEGTGEGWVGTEGLAQNGKAWGREEEDQPGHSPPSLMQLFPRLANFSSFPATLRGKWCLCLRAVKCNGGHGSSAPQGCGEATSQAGLCTAPSRSSATRRFGDDVQSLHRKRLPTAALALHAS